MKRNEKTTQNIFVLKEIKTPSSMINGDVEHVVVCHISSTASAHR